MLVSSKIPLALKIATDRHANEYRKGTARLPYLIHPLQVVARLGEWGLTSVTDPIIVAAALLHDVLEDVSVMAESYWATRIQYEVGQDVFDIVKEMTFRPDEHSSHSQQKSHYLETFAEKSSSALTLKVADRICNVMDFLREGDTKYAGVYLQKADNIFRFVRNRQAEFSSDVYYFMTENIEAIQQVVTPV